MLMQLDKNGTYGIKGCYTLHISLYSFSLFHSLNQITYLYTAAPLTGNRQRMLKQYFFSMQPNTPNLFNQQHILLMAQILNKMGRFFQDMAYDCMQHLSPTQSQQPSLVKEQGLQPSIVKNPSNQKQEGKKKDNNLFRIKSHKPKHPVSSFFIFYKEKGQEIAKERGEILGCKIAKIVGELWKSMSDAEKQPYEAKAKVARQKYEQQMIQYKVNYTDEIQRLKNYKRIARLKRKEAEQLQSKMQQPQNPSSESFTHLQTQISPEVKQQQQSVAEQSQSGSLSSQQSQSNFEDGLSDSLEEGMKHGQPLNASSEVVSQEESSLSQKLKIEQEQPIDQQFPFEQDILGQLDILLKENQTTDKTPKISTSIKQSTQSNQFQDSRQESSFPSQSSDKYSDNSGPSKPKAPISSFFLFYKAKGKEISRQKGLAPGPKLIRIVSGVWNSMSPEEKKIYEEQALEARAKYKHDMEKLRENKDHSQHSSRKQRKNGQPDKIIRSQKQKSNYPE